MLLAACGRQQHSPGEHGVVQRVEDSSGARWGEARGGFSAEVEQALLQLCKLPPYKNGTDPSAAEGFLFFLCCWRLGTQSGPRPPHPSSHPALPSPSVRYLRGTALWPSGSDAAWASRLPSHPAADI